MVCFLVGDMKRAAGDAAVLEKLRLEGAENGGRLSMC